MMSKRIYTYSYDYTTSPSIPVIPVEVAYRDNAITVPAIVDSGCDATMVPSRIIKQIKARREDEQRVRGVAGFSYTVYTYRVRIRFADFDGYATVLEDRNNDQMLLGRDIINHLELTLNGLAGMVEIPAED